mmetsp:Transcript_39812/g.104162  ORF Transcript_39812/g.104162 Transcript_39812/m.104162 type:complete len:218 (-) Transcript_39812:1088-1741(-)
MRSHNRQWSGKSVVGWRVALRRRGLHLRDATMPNQRLLLVCSEPASSLAVKLPSTRHINSDNTSVDPTAKALGHVLDSVSHNIIALKTSACRLAYPAKLVMVLHRKKIAALHIQFHLIVGVDSNDDSLDPLFAGYRVVFNSFLDLPSVVLLHLARSRKSNLGLLILLVQIKILFHVQLDTSVLAHTDNERPNPFAFSHGLVFNQIANTEFAIRCPSL